MNKFYNHYRLWLNSDQGRYRIIMAARSMEEAIEWVMKVEGCPRRSILEVEMLGY